MSSVEQGTSGHRRAWDLIPWVINGRASAGERALVESHLTQCSDCRDEFAFQQQVHGAMLQQSTPEGSPRASLDRLWSRIESSDASADDKILRAASPRMLRWLAVAVVVEAVGLAALSTQVWFADSDSAPYRTLSMAATPAPRATIRVVLAPELATADLQALLQETQLQIVAGPSEAGVYSLAPLAADAATPTPLVLRRLRDHPGVRFAEPVSAPADERK